MLHPQLNDITEQISLTPMLGWGIPIALVGAVFLSLGTQFQHRGVHHVGDANARQGAALGWQTVKRLLAKPTWVIGTVLLCLAVVLQLWALALAPLIVVQPIGAVALVITAILNARMSRHRLDPGTIRAITYCLIGIGVFVTVAAVFAVEHEITDRQLLTVLSLLVVVLAGVGIAWWFWRTKANAIFYIIAAGVLYGFVVTLSKVVINRIIVLVSDIENAADRVEWLTILCAIGLVIALIVGGYFVQLAHASGPPDLVIAGLTVVDPLIAVLIGVAILGEASATPPWALIVFAAAGALAVFGVFQLAKHHPQLQPERSEDHP